ncbi:Fcf2-domain-containing protein [Aspergillus campestris IBT 28561]|uniref:Fcf2-domain-containing protein n=1 Tax=Aspergillus campestris (strain IBT 28561) TaxID=1392248 RepID=A0A2I1DAK6_ASPC2|nr:Fcf2-domain-containing protein [Aspergillus campestris IBT 28561]PKY06905.1 Fcf2-domain-containing protein [Aspergillus campestris IBT 28561]
MTALTCEYLAANINADTDNMADHDIQQLLLQAEGRLRAHNVKETHDSVLQRHSDKYSDGTTSSLKVPKLASEHSLQPYVREQGDIATVDPAHVIQPSPNKSTVFQMSNTEKTGPANKDKPTAGKDWFDMPRTELTPELKRDLQILRMRSVLDPKRHYKKENAKTQPPKYLQVGTVLEGPTEFFSNRITKKNQRKTFVEEALAVEQQARRLRSKYNDIQSNKQSGKKAYYQNLRSKRQGKKNT